MAIIQVAASRAFPVPAPLVYDILADYREGHPSILPDAFSNLEVLEGGIGAGTIIQFDLKLAGRTSTTTATVSEPEPGRVLREIESQRGLATTFTVESKGSGGCRVSIVTTWKASVLKGLVERLLVPAMLRPLYEEQLDKIGQVAGARLAASRA
jgi:hypothetical protein